MPWDQETVKKHNKGLNLAQRKRWAKIANAVLKKCEDEGGEDCEAMAIRIANSKFEKKSRRI